MIRYKNDSISRIRTHVNSIVSLMRSYRVAPDSSANTLLLLGVHMRSIVGTSYSAFGPCLVTQPLLSILSLLPNDTTPTETRPTESTMRCTREYGGGKPRCVTLGSREMPAFTHIMCRNSLKVGDLERQSYHSLFPPTRLKSHSSVTRPYIPCI